MPQVILIPVQSNQQKLSQIIQIATKHFKKREPLTILVDTEAAKNYIDELLWKQPTESFLPHDGELITIAMEPSSGANNYFNLTQQALVHISFAKVYEFDDQTSADKQTASKMRYASYREKSFPIVTL